MKQPITPGKTRARIVDISAKAKKLDPKIVERAFGARPVGSSKGLDLFALREVMGRMLQSAGGRPSLEGTVAQTKIPKIAADWEKLEKLALASSDLKHKPSTGQMAAIVLHLALDRISEEEIAKAARKEFA